MRCANKNSKIWIIGILKCLAYTNDTVGLSNCGSVLLWVTRCIDAKLM